MNRNQKIALGCGGAGCLGLIVVGVAGVLIYYFAYRAQSDNRDFNFNTSTNRNSNSNDNTDFTSNSNDDNTSNSSNSSSSSASSLSDDDKHKLYQAAVMTADQELRRRVEVKLGLMDEDMTPGDNYAAFVQEHVGWVISNYDFVQSINTQEKARAYVNEHFPN